MTTEDTSILLQNVMTMRTAADALISIKMSYPDQTEKHKKDLEDLSRIIYHYDMMIRNMLELMIRQQEMHDEFIAKVKAKLDESGA